MINPTVVEPENSNHSLAGTTPGTTREGAAGEALAIEVVGEDIREVIEEVADIPGVERRWVPPAQG